MDVDTFQSQALEVRMPDENFDPTKEPEDGEEFLMKVVYERNHCPAIVAKKPPSITKKKNQLQSVNLVDVPYDDEVQDTAPDDLRPSEPWKQIQIQDFLQLRNRILCLRTKLYDCGYIVENSIEFTEDSTKWLEFCQNNKPLLQTILRVNQRTLEKLLEFEAEWIKNILLESSDRNKTILEDWLGQWIFSTLACLHLPLEPDTHSVLRDIARSCVLLRNRLKPEEKEKALPVNLIIVIISKIFDQLDLFKFV